MIRYKKANSLQHIKYGGAVSRILRQHSIERKYCLLADTVPFRKFTLLYSEILKQEFSERWASENIHREARRKRKQTCFSSIRQFTPVFRLNFRRGRMAGFREQAPVKDKTEGN